MLDWDDIAKRSAATPSSDVDIERVIRRGGTLKRQRFFSVTAFVVLVAASSIGILNASSSDEPTLPPADSTTLERTDKEAEVGDAQMKLQTRLELLTDLLAETTSELEASTPGSKEETVLTKRADVLHGQIAKVEAKLGALLRLGETKLGPPFGRAAKRFPIPVTPADRPFEGGRCGEDPGPVCVYEPSYADSEALSGRVFGHRRPLEGARVYVYLETMDEPLMAVTDRWGQFAYTNLPIRHGGENVVTCGTQKVAAVGFGRYAQGIDDWYDAGGYTQLIELAREPQVDWWGNAYDPPQRCVEWSEDHGYR